MYFQLPLGDQTVHTHSSLVDEEKQAQIQSIYSSIPAWQNATRFLLGYFTMEAVNRISALKKLPFAYRAGIVAAPVLLGGFIGEATFWAATNNWTQVKNLLAGVPVYANKIEVPELDKAYFFLDDDKGFQPSLNHHATTKGRTYLALYNPSA